MKSHDPVAFRREQGSLGWCSCDSYWLRLARLTQMPSPSKGSDGLTSMQSAERAGVLKEVGMMWRA